MADFDDGLVIGLAIGKKKFKSGGNEKKWEYPKEWLPLPTPAENEVCFLILLDKEKLNGGELRLHFRADRKSEDGITIDWGDGVTDNYDGVDISNPNVHTYTAGKGTALSDKIEMYIVKAAYKGTVKFDEITGVDSAIRTVAAAIDGTAMSRSYQNPNGSFFSQPIDLRYLRFTGDPTHWQERIYSGFNTGTYSLARVDFDFSSRVTKLPPGTFQSCTALTDANMPDLSAVRECTDKCFDYCPCLKKISMPELETIGGRAFCSCYAVEALELPKLKVIGLKDYPDRSFDLFHNFYGLKKLSLPSLETVYASKWASVFRSCYSLESLDLPKLKTMPVSAGNIGGSDTKSMRYLNAPGVDTTGWFSGSYWSQNTETGGMIL